MHECHKSKHESPNCQQKLQVYSRRKTQMVCIGNFMTRILLRPPVPITPIYLVNIPIPVGVSLVIGPIVRIPPIILMILNLIQLSFLSETFGTLSFLRLALSLVPLAALVHLTLALAQRLRIYRPFGNLF